MADLYKFKVKQSDLILAFENYLQYRHQKANQERIQAIHSLTTPTKSFFGLFTKAPICSNTRDAIRYMKSTYHDFYPGSLWSACEFSGSLWTDTVKKLLKELKTKKARGDVYLTDNMSFLLNWINR